MAARYLAMVKKPGDTAPRKLTFAAGEDANSAINEMVKRCGVSSTADLSDFQILRITEDSKAYVLVAERIQVRDKGNVAKLVPSVKKEENKAMVCCAPIAPVVQQDSEEECYIPYNVVNE